MLIWQSIVLTIRFRGYQYQCFKIVIIIVNCNIKCLLCSIPIYLYIYTGQQDGSKMTIRQRKQIKEKKIRQVVIICTVRNMVQLKRERGRLIIYAH